ncbi:entericidin A/B family lipoprotein [Cognatishimia sp. MH4019]|nr:entericidin A/B family lipoprotein [Cognatishimia sp. MH4019]
MRIASLLFAVCALAACETVEGAGQDISTAGDVISQESREVQSQF